MTKYNFITKPCDWTNSVKIIIISISVIIVFSVCLLIILSIFYEELRVYLIIGFSLSGIVSVFSLSNPTFTDNITFPKRNIISFFKDKPWKCKIPKMRFPEDIPKEFTGASQEYAYVHYSTDSWIAVYFNNKLIYASYLHHNQDANEQYFKIIGILDKIMKA